jgi:tetratricopeptide (TPR) repeat protein
VTGRGAHTFAMCFSRTLALCWLLTCAAALAQSSAPNDRVTRLIERGDAQRARGDVNAALGYYRDAISVGPRRSEGYAALGGLYLAIEEPRRALEVFEVGARSAGRGEALWLGFARALSAVGQPERALSALRSLRSTDPRSLEGLRILAEALESRALFIEALSVRRARLAQLEGAAADAQAAAGERAHVRALEYVLAGAERTRTRDSCADAETSAVRRALARCP